MGDNRGLNTRRRIPPSIDSRNNCTPDVINSLHNQLPVTASHIDGAADHVKFTGSF